MFPKSNGHYHVRFKSTRNSNSPYAIRHAWSSQSTHSHHSTRASHLVIHAPRPIVFVNVVSCQELQLRGGIFWIFPYSCVLNFWEFIQTAAKHLRNSNKIVPEFVLRLSWKKILVCKRRYFIGSIWLGCSLLWSSLILCVVSIFHQC